MNPYQSPDVPSDVGSYDWLYILMFGLACVIFGPFSVSLAIRQPTKSYLIDGLLSGLCATIWQAGCVVIILRIILWLVKS